MLPIRGEEEGRKEGEKGGIYKHKKRWGRRYLRR